MGSIPIPGTYYIPTISKKNAQTDIYKSPIAVKVKRIVIREAMVLVVMVLIMAILWLAGNYIIASRYKPEFAGVQKELAQLDANKQSAIKKAAKEKVLVYPVRYIIYLLQWAVAALKSIDRNLLR